MAKNNDGFDRGAVRSSARKTLMDQLGYTDVGPARLGEDDCILAMVDGKPTVLVWVPEQPGPISPADQAYAQELSAETEGGLPAYVWATSTGDLNEGFIYCWLPDKDCEVSAVPPQAAAVPGGAAGQRRGDAAGFKQLQHDFDRLHEQIYAAREPVDSSNDLTAQLCKCIFLKMHLERHPDFRSDASSPRLMEVFDAAYIRKHGQSAVDEVKKAFTKAKGLEEYNVVDDAGHSFEIFDKDEFIKFRRPETYALIAEFLNRHQLRNPEDTGIEDDMVGRAFDVMLRGKFENKGGMGIYLTPQQVRDAMVQMVFHDILTEDPGLLTRTSPDTGKPVLRVYDPCCGSGGFLTTSMRETRKHVEKLVGMSSAQRAALLREIYEHGFQGSDNASNMVLLARINMALHGDARPKIFRVSNSLTTDIFEPESFDLILTNPPFKKGGVKQKDQPEVLSAYRSAIGDDSEFVDDPAGLALGAKPNNKGVWKPVDSVDPAVLFIDRCLQLLRPGGRLLIVLPDGILCNSGDRYVREYLMGVKDEKSGRFIGGKAVVKAVVSLPPVTFRLSGAGAKTSFLYLQKKRPGDEQGPVFMAVADQVGFDVKQNKEVQLGNQQNDLLKIVEAYRMGPPTPGADA